MQETVALIFGYFVLLTAFGLAGWEIYVYTRCNEDFRWLHTHTRFRRRITMAILLLFVGILILGESYGVLHLDNLRHLLMYVTSLGVIALSLVVLSIRDLSEMARNAERRAMEDLQRAIDEQKRREGPHGGR